MLMQKKTKEIREYFGLLHARYTHTHTNTYTKKPNRKKLLY
jgi:hypothetical protein